jgi:hypothetical protein
MTNSQSPSRLYFLGAISIMFELRLIVGTYFWTNSKQFKLASVNYVSVSGNTGPRYLRYEDAFARAFSDSEKTTD